MAEFFQSLSDNQTALLICGGSLIGGFLMLSTSFYANPANREERKGAERPSVEVPVAAQRKKAA